MVHPEDIPTSALEGTAWFAHAVSQHRSVHQLGCASHLSLRAAVSACSLTRPPVSRPCCTSCSSVAVPIKLSCHIEIWFVWNPRKLAGAMDTDLSRSRTPH
jgi:hypothetical protein